MAPEAVIIAALVLFIALVTVIVGLTHRLARPPAAAINELSSAVTEVLTTLEAESHEFRTDSAAIRRNLMRKRLRRLQSAFDLTAVAIKLAAVQSERDRPDLIRLLAREQIIFTYRMMSLRLRLVCHL